MIRLVTITLAGLALTVAALAATALAQDAPPAAPKAAPPAESVARFRVLKPDGTPLASTDLVLQHYKGLKTDRNLPAEHPKVATDADGYFTRPIGPGGSWRINILIKNVGYVLSERFETAPGQPLEMTLTLRPGTTLSGRVIDQATGQGIPKAWINIYSSEDAMSGYPQIGPGGVATDGQGRWKLTNVPDGRWSVSASARGYISRGSDHPLTVQNGQAADGIELGLTRGAVLRVQVLDPDGKPLAKTKIMTGLDRLLNGNFDGGNSGDYVTDAEGCLTFDGLQDSTWRLRARVRGLGYAFGDPVEVKAGAEPAKLTVQLKKGMSVSARVVVAGTDRPVDKASIYLRPADFADPWAPLESVPTDADGRWQQTNIAPGQFVLCVQKEAYVQYENAVTVTEGRDLADLKVELKPFVPLRGLILAPDGRAPVPGATVRYNRTTVAADAQGRFAIAVPPGAAVSLTVAAPGFAAQTALLTAQEALDAPEQRIVLAARGTAVSGRITNLDLQQPVVNQEVLLAKYEKDSHLDRVIQQGDLWRRDRHFFDAFGGTQNGPVAATDATGSYTFADVPPGDYVALILPAEGINLCSKPFKVVEGRPVDGIDFQITRRPMGFAAIRILGPDGRPLAGKQMSYQYTTEDHSESGTRQLGPEALIYRPLKKPGTVRVVATVEGYSIVERSDRVADTNVCLELDLKLAPQKADAVLTGRVFLSDGKTPAADVLVTPYVVDRPWPESGANYLYGDRSYRFITNCAARTAADGTFRLERLRPARYGIQATPLKELCSWNDPAREELASYFPVLSETQLELPESGLAGGLEVALGLGGTFEGQVLDSATGKPVEKTHVELRRDSGRLWVDESKPRMQVWHVIELTDAEGRFRIRGLPPGAYPLSVSADGYKYLRQDGWKSIKIKAGQSAQRTIKLEAQPHSEDEDPAAVPPSPLRERPRLQPG